MFELFDQMRRSSKRAAMATLVRARGTTPRKDGAKMFVSEDGGVLGTITIGGCVDARVMEAATDVLRGSKPRLLSLQLGDEEASEIGLTCGGAVDVFVEPVGQELFDVYDRAQSVAKAGRLAAIETTIAGASIGAHSLLEGDLSLLSNAIRERDDRTSYIELLRPATSLMIFGAGAVAIPLATFAKTLGFRTTVIDGRPRFANRERFPSADVLRVGIVSEIVRQVEIGGSTAVVLIAHDFKIDGPVLERVLATPTPYVGLLGSKKRGAAIRQALRERGVSEADLTRVRVPVGLDIGGETPAEIALSIASEIVAVMHGRAGMPLSAARGASQ
ncbi:MAG TPA: XdhC/CoxI family protein [Thermoanaerobaculia bacterium]